MRYAIALEHEADDAYHYLPDGGNLTTCGLEAHQVLGGIPEDRRLCEACDHVEFSSMDELVFCLGVDSRAKARAPADAKTVNKNY